MRTVDPGRQRGLTLLETLVTLVIVAMVAGLMSEGLYQLGHIERRLGSAQMQAQLQRLRLLWVQQALEGLQAGRQDTPEFFRGGPQRMQGVSSVLPQAELRGPLPMQLTLVHRAEQGYTELTLAYGAPGGAQTTAVLAQWRGDAGRFRYLDQQGQWVAEWPSQGAGSPLPAGADPPLLPRAVAVHGQGDELLLVAAPQATPQPLGKRIDLDKMP